MYPTTPRAREAVPVPGSQALYRQLHGSAESLLMAARLAQGYRVRERVPVLVDRRRSMEDRRRSARQCGERVQQAGFGIAAIDHHDPINFDTVEAKFNVSAYSWSV
jgi:hypothetical protein